MRNSIELKNICKSFGSVTALDSISLTVPKGSIFGLIGPDGAGKTTLFRILTTLLLADSGDAKIASFDVVKEFKEIRKIVGYMPGKFSLYQDLSVEENLNFFATIFNTTVEENYDSIQEIYIQLEPFKKRKAGALSGGMKQKLALCCALVHKPKVLFLDEPTTGVDVVSRKEFWDMLKRIRDGGTTIFVSTPYMDEASLCDKIALIQNGKILSIDTPEVIVSRFPETLWGISSNNMYKLYNDLVANEKVLYCQSFGATHHISLDPNFRVELLESKLKDQNHQQIRIQQIQPTIEDCFIHLMQHPSETI